MSKSRRQDHKTLPLEAIRQYITTAKEALDRSITKLTALENKIPMQRYNTFKRDLDAYSTSVIFSKDTPLKNIKTDDTFFKFLGKVASMEKELDTQEKNLPHESKTESVPETKEAIDREAAQLLKEIEIENQQFTFNEFARRPIRANTSPEDIFKIQQQTQKEVEGKLPGLAFKLNKFNDEYTKSTPTDTLKQVKQKIEDTFAELKKQLSHVSKSILATQKADIEKK